MSLYISMLDKKKKTQQQQQKTTQQWRQNDKWIISPTLAIMRTRKIRSRTMKVIEGGGYSGSFDDESDN